MRRPAYGLHQPAVEPGQKRFSGREAPLLFIGLQRPLPLRIVVCSFSVRVTIRYLHPNLPCYLHNFDACVLLRLCNRLNVLPTLSDQRTAIYR